jgi:hypothetical protein
MSAAVMLTPAATGAAARGLDLCANVCACVERISNEASRKFLENKSENLS